jgi:hypothetical protein
MMWDALGEEELLLAFGGGCLMFEFALSVGGVCVVVWC